MTISIIKRYFTHYFSLIIIITSSAQLLAAPETINVYSYHLHPPFITSPEHGLSHDVIQLLNNKADGQYQFKLQMVPRRRLNLILSDWTSGQCVAEDNQCNKNWMVLWVNPKWGFGQQATTTFQWKFLLEDSNSIISLQDHPIEYQGPESLLGLRLGGIGGHRYVGIDEKVEAGLIIRIDGNHERNNVMKLLAQRIDTILLPTSTMQYYLSQDKVIKQNKDKFFLSPKKHQEYTRNIMLSRQAIELNKFIEDIDLFDAEWVQKLNQYGLK